MHPRAPLTPDTGSVPSPAVLAPEITAVLEDWAKKAYQPLPQLTLAQARAMLEDLASTYGPAPEPVDVSFEETIPAPGGTMRVRILRPHGSADASPGIVFFHGGGWVIGSLDTHDAICRSLSRRAQAVVVSVEYRLAPEAPFPAPLDDSYAGLEWVHANASRLGIDSTRLMVAGDSAGGNLAAAVAVMARDRRGPALSHQILLYPVTDFEFERPSFVAFGRDHFLTADDMRWFWSNYVPAELAGDPRASVLRTVDVTGLPPATILTAECDPLRDQAEAYAERLAEAGVETALRREPGMSHGFITMAGWVPRASDALDYLAQRIMEAPAVTSADDGQR